MAEDSVPRIVVGIDGSAQSRDALAWALNQARLAGAVVEAVIAWHVPSFVYAASISLPSGLDFEDDARRVLEEVLDEVAAGNLATIRKVVKEGNPGMVLMAEAKGADLLVVGSSGHGALAGMLLGSVTEQCVKHAPCPVVVVRH